GDRDNWGGRDLPRQRRQSDRSGDVLVEAPPHDRAQWIAFQSLGSLGKLDLVRMAQVESKLRRGRITPCRFDLDATQNHLLQPRRIVGLQSTRRNRVAPEPTAHSVHRLALAEGTDTRRKEI